MATRQQSTSSTRQADVPKIVFSDEDGIFWLRGDNLARAKKVLDLCPEQGPFGLDAETIKLYIDELIEQGVSVGISCGSKVWTITKKEPYKPGKVASKIVWLAATLLFDERELSCLKHRLNGNGSAVRDLVETMRTQIAVGDAVKEYGSLYVFQVAENLYEVDELTTIPKATVEALAVAAYETGTLLCCQLIAPKSKRINGNRQTRKAVTAPTPQFVVSKTVAYGQLRFDI